MSKPEEPRDWFVPAQPSPTPIFDHLLEEMSGTPPIREIHLGVLLVKTSEEDE